jgi:ubiquitin C-terminal hydrolase
MAQSLLGRDGRVEGLVVGEADVLDGIQVGVGEVEAHGEIVVERGNEDVVDQEQEQDCLAECGVSEPIPVHATVETGSPNLPTHKPTQSEQIPVQATVEAVSPSLPTNEPAQSERIPVQTTVETGSPILSTHESTHESSQSPSICKSVPARLVKQHKAARSAESARTVKPTGIRNMGNTCYLNSILQALSVFEEIYSSCPQKPGFLKAFLDAMKLLSSGRSPPVQPVALLRQLQSEMRVTFRDFNYNTPQDVPHILSVFMEKINAESESSRQLSEISVRTVTTCSVCSFKSVKIEAQKYLNVPVCESLSEMVSEFTAEQVMDGDNAYSCPQCACKQKAFRREELASAPLMLVLVLRRFVTSCRQGSLQPAFTRSRQCVNHRLPLEVSLRDDVGGEQSVMFEAVTVVHHKGSLSGADGHYFAHVKKDQRWYKCNDSIVKNSVHRNIGSETAYVIFCKRI